MASISEALAVAVQQHQAGRLQIAEQIYRQILAVDPRQSDALHLLGVVAHQTGRLDLAIELIEDALRQAPDNADAHFNLANALKAGGRLTEATACYRAAVRLKPDYVEAHNNLGAVLQEQGILEEAAACFQQALRLNPDSTEAHNNLGNALKEQGQIAAAIDCYRRALELRPGYVEALNNLGIALKSQRQTAEAVACLQQAVEANPAYAQAHNNLGAAFQDQGQLDEAIACYRRTLELQPDYAEAHNNLGTALKDQGRLPQAIACFRRALALKPQYAITHYNLGAAFRDQGMPVESIACYRQALELKPEFAEAETGLGTVLKDQGNLDEAVACFQRALEINPDDATALGSLVHQRQQMCLWKDLSGLSKRLIEAVDLTHPEALADPPPPFALLALPATPSQQLRCAQQWVNRRLQAAMRQGNHLALTASRARRHKSKLIVGYLSADFHAHPIAYLVSGLFEQHDRDRVAVYGYSYGPDDGSPVRRRLASAVDRFVDLQNTSYVEAAQLIAADGVDILVDLTGYTGHARSQIPALRPAPIQVNYLGYPGTMAAPFMDYILVDDFVAPVARQGCFTEKLVYLPGCYQVSDRQREVPPSAPSRAQCGLPAAGFVFCSFNNSFKITPEVFRIWMELLKAVPGSLLWLLESNRFAPENLRREAESSGVSAERLVFAPRRPIAEHLARQRLADLFLDTFPYNSHTTASDALWAGCPLLTIAGETFASRVAGSILRALGLQELIAGSLDEYRARALRLAQDAGSLAALRARLEANRQKSPLFDARAFADNVERAYGAMWEIFVAGDQPRSFDVSVVRN